MLLPRLAWTQVGKAPQLYWRLNESGDSVREVESGSSDSIESRTGHALWVGSGSNRALRLDGYSVWVRHAAAQLPLNGAALTVGAWLALEAYPVDTAAIVELESPADGIIRLTVDKLGYLEFTARKGDALATSKSAMRIPKLSWAHVAVTSSDTEITLYLDGKICATTKTAAGFPKAQIAGVTLGRSTDCPVIAEVFPTGVLNGLIRDVRVYDERLTGSEIDGILSEGKPDAPPDLEINGSWCAADPQRPIYHALPPRAWTNEPHGLIHWGGQYHLFYQKNPNGPYWGHIHWGHMTSPDLTRWTEMPVALAPEPGPDSDGCWSGSVIDFEGKLALIYTAGDGHRSTICLAMSNDGIHFTNIPATRLSLKYRRGEIFPNSETPTSGARAIPTT